MNNNQQPSIASLGQVYFLSASDGTKYAVSNAGYMYRIVDYNEDDDYDDGFDFGGFTADMKYVMTTAGLI
jgi:hypothetical protein